MKPLLTENQSSMALACSASFWSPPHPEKKFLRSFGFELTASFLLLHYSKGDSNGKG